jgi:hypothetical protein
MVYALIEPFSVEITFRKRNCNSYLMLDTSMWLRISKLPWLRSTCETHVTLFVTIYTSVTDLAPRVRLHHPVLWTREIILLHATGGSLFRNVFIIIWQASFDNHLKGKTIVQRREVCLSCTFTVTNYSKHECFKWYFYYSNKKQISCNFCYVAPMKPSKLTGLCMFSLARNVHRTLESMICPLSIFRTSFVVSKCVQSAKWMSIVNSVVSVPTCLWQKTM